MNQSSSVSEHQKRLKECIEHAFQASIFKTLSLTLCVVIAALLCQVVHFRNECWHVC